ncbi:Acg family FMN-binding oxidoreductase [Mycobacterium talmoniae]|uniref:NAD(P)H nitroreductase n=2 Tax=Mycobacterium talmoniae TaxID=1858794 RepID=A0A1S1NJ36_9MYCO|nr:MULTISPECIES: nitroreductase family protein [Mycobacterium]OHV06057.1 NAD(P)H nitroreductase [Mycobacterium talmoniae]TDH48041.1 NAD(P)H nitroreductase [Mycobacterium eburneum]
METQFPDTETIQTALTLAARAPSMYNTQPWRWRVGARRLHLYADPSRQLHSADPEGRDLILSCGATLHHAVVALAALGWRAKVHHFPDPTDADHLASIEVSTGDVDQVDVMLAAAIPRRRTDRRRYGPWPVPTADTALMAARAARCGVMLRQIDDLATLHAIVTQAIWEHATNYDYVNEATMWSGRYGSLAGVPARNTPACDCTATIPSRLFAGPTLAQPPETSPADDHAVMLALGTVTDDRLAWLRAGEAASVVLLTATALGLASCPITEPLEITQTRDAVRSDVFGASGYPQMLLRVGWAPINADPLPATPRRALHDVVHWEREGKSLGVVGGVDGPQQCSVGP